MHSHRAIKSLGGNRIGEYIVLFGNERLTDASSFRDYFDDATQFMLDAYEKRPMLYHHALESSAKVHPALAADPLIGYWDTARPDQFGIWAEGELLETHPAFSAVKAQVERGELFPSSDSADHLVRRTKQASGAHHVDRWPLLACSLTPLPAEPRMASVGVIEAACKTLGVEFVLPEERPAEPVESPIVSGIVTGAAKSEYFGEFAEMDMTVAAVDSLKNRLCYGVLYMILSDDKATAEEKKTKIAEAYDEFKALSLKVINALLDGAGDETAAGAIKSLEKLRTFYLSVAPRDGLPQSEHNRMARETLRGYVQRMVEYGGMKTNGLPPERMSEINGLFADMAAAQNALTPFLSPSDSAPDALAAFHYRKMRRDHELRQHALLTT